MFLWGAVAEGCSGAVARLVGDGVLAVPGRGSSVAIGTRRASLFRARPASSCTRCQTCPGRAHLLAVLQECHRLAGGFAAYPAPYCATGSLPGPRPKARRLPPPPRARGLEQVTPQPPTNTRSPTLNSEEPDKYSDVWRSYVNDEMTPAEFRDWHNTAGNYRVEFSSRNRARIDE